MECAEVDCTRPMYSRGRCRSCYAKSIWRLKHNRPEPPGLVPDGALESAQRRYAIWMERRANRTHCINGHELSPANVYKSPTGYVVCKICRRNSKRKRNGRAPSKSEMDLPVALHNGEKAHCAQGHSFAEHGINMKRGRVCRICRIAERRSRLYGLKQHEYDRMYASQDGSCAICKQRFESARTTHIDHDHRSGKVRALLCSSCNRILGLAREDPDRLRQAAKYIEQHRERIQRILANE